MDRLENSAAKVILKEDRTRSIVNRHPWIFSGAIQSIHGVEESGEIASVYSHDGVFQGKGFVNSKSQIVVRLLTFQDEPVNADFFINRLRRAFDFRRRMIRSNTNAWRIVHGDADFLTGLVVDKYADTLVVQIFSAGMERIKNQLVEWLRSVVNPSCILERREARILDEEGIKSNKEVLWGKLENPVLIQENGIRYEVDVWDGQKTGFFLDQRENRERIGKLAAGKRLLNCFSYTGGFSLAAAKNGASTVSVEIREAAQQAAQKNFTLNNIDPGNHKFINANVFEYLRDIDEKFDLIVLDPPAFVKKKSYLNRGSRGYKDVNRLAIQKSKKDGLILSCSCSHYITWDLFQKIIFAAAKDADRDVQIIGKFSQPFDHAVSIYHPESEYLKSFLLRVL